MGVDSVPAMRGCRGGSAPPIVGPVYRASGVPPAWSSMLLGALPARPHAVQAASAAAPHCALPEQAASAGSQEDLPLLLQPWRAYGSWSLDHASVLLSSIFLSNLLVVRGADALI